MATSLPPSESGLPNPSSVPAVPPPATARRPNRLPLYVAVGAVAVVLLLLLLLVAAPMLTGSGKGGSSTVEMTYAHAKPIADNAMANFQGGGWAAVLASGVAPENSTVLPRNLTSVSSSTNCSLNLSAGAPANLTVPAFNGTRTSGVAPLWFFIYKNVAGLAAIVVVLNGQATVLGTISGGVCASIFAFLSPIPSNVIDSSQVAAAVSGAAATFLASYPNASTDYALLGGLNFGVLSRASQWSVLYTTCPLASSGSNGVGAQFNATVNATTGQVISTQTTTGVSCSSSSGTPLGSALAFGPASSTISPPYTNVTYPVSSASGGVSWSDFTASLRTSTGVSVPSGWLLLAQTSAGATIATFDPTFGAWSGASAAAISTVDQIVLTSTNATAGDLLTLTGVGSYSGTILLFVP